MSKKLITILLALALAGTTLASCGSDTAEDTTDEKTSAEETTEAPKAEVSIEELHTAIKEAYGEDYLPNMPVPDDETFEMMFGIPADLCEEYVAETPMIMTQIDTLLIIKPAEGKAADVVAALETYHEGQQMFQYPMNQAKAEAAQIYEKGDYVFYIRLGILPDYTDTEFEGLTDEEIAAKETERYDLAVENNQKAIEAIDALLG